MTRSGLDRAVPEGEPGLQRAIPADAVTGVGERPHPHISPANAAIQRRAWPGHEVPS